MGDVADASASAPVNPLPPHADPLTRASQCDRSKPPGRLGQGPAPANAPIHPHPREPTARRHRTPHPQPHRTTHHTRCRATLVVVARDRTRRAGRAGGIDRNRSVDRWESQIEPPARGKGTRSLRQGLKRPRTSAGAVAAHPPCLPRRWGPRAISRYRYR